MDVNTAALTAVQMAELWADGSDHHWVEWWALLLVATSVARRVGVLGLKQADLTESQKADVMVGETVE